MDFAPLIRAKKRNGKRVKSEVQLLPTYDCEQKIKSHFNGLFVEVSAEDSIQLHKYGHFGQVQHDEVLVVCRDGDLMSWRELLEAALQVNANFIDSFAAYLYLRSKGWIVTSGIKFGGNFLIYKNGPNFYHASFVVLLERDSASYAAKDIKGCQRVAETANKDVLILNVIKPPAFDLNALDDFKEIEVSETIIRRFQLTSFVQQQSKTKTNKNT